MLLQRFARIPLTARLQTVRNVHLRSLCTTKKDEAAFGTAASGTGASGTGASGTTTDETASGTAASGVSGAPNGGAFLHFRNTTSIHPLGVPKKRIEALSDGTWPNPTENHVWSDEEIKERLSTQPRHQPETIADHLAVNFLRAAYWTFNTVTGYQAANPSTASVAFRLIFLESVAGVPGMVAAQHRHFRSLRTLERDYGWIHTLLEEAENERMHLLTFLTAFPPGLATRASIFGTQFGFGALFISLYVLSPKTAHRLVGYIEEMAVVTYVNVIEMIETPGTNLNKDVLGMPAPEIARTYWRLPHDADMLDVIKQVAVDETNHRDCNHTFASMARDDPNPYVFEHAKAQLASSEYWQELSPPVEGKDVNFAMQPKVPIKAGS